jgi:glutathione S-transferase
MNLSAPATLLAAAITLVAILITIAFSIMVSKVRTRHDVQPPAMSGSPEVERALRVHGNTVEQLVVFLPALWLAAIYFQGWAPPAIGAVWCVGRLLYAVSYMAAANKRLVGFILTIIPTLALIVLAVIGLVGAWTAATA